MTAVIPLVSRLSSRIIRVLGCNPGHMTLQGTNTYIVGSGTRRILIDTGDANVPEYITNLSSVLQEENIKLDHIVVTHWHHDHIGGLIDVAEKFGKNFTVWKYQRSDCDNDLSLNGIPLSFLKDGQEIVVDDNTLRIVHTPGHTTDHIVAILKEENALFSGDCILGEGTAVFEDLFDYMNSLTSILKIKPTVIFPGHGPVIENPELRIKEYIDHRRQRESQIHSVLTKYSNKDLTEMDIVKQIYKDTPEHLYFAAASNVYHHLVKLEKENIVQKTNDGWRLKVI